MFAFADHLDNHTRDGLYAIVAGYLVENIERIISNVFLAMPYVKSGYDIHSNDDLAVRLASTGI
jgi:hypothetical protein